MPETINASKARPVAPLTLEQIKGAMGKEVLARPKLSIGDVAAMLGVGPRTLSAVLKREWNGNFCSFVSDLRLAEAARLLRLHRYARFSAEQIGLMAGFASRQSFYPHFKEKYGCTPIEYRSRNINENKRPEDADY
ncbi:MAG: helix-turn-helix transcriptional regulator [Bacteroidales bacterium]|nr:helix-turn-helix transcriptional regulator [Bacteroidales bacterium]